MPKAAKDKIVPDKLVLIAICLKANPSMLSFLMKTKITRYKGDTDEQSCSDWQY